MTKSDKLASILKSNQLYAEKFGSRAQLEAIPKQKLAVLTCMDSRLEPLQCLGLNLGDAHIIRNAGGRASDDAIRSLVVSHKLTATEHWLVIHHTACAMETINDELMGELLHKSLKPAQRTDVGWQNSETNAGTTEGKYVHWLGIKDSKQSIIDDVQRIKNSPLVSASINIYGLLYDCHSGKLIEVCVA